VDLLAGLEGEEWVGVLGQVDRIIPNLAGIELALTAGSNDLQALGERTGIEVPRLDLMRASGTLVGDLEDLMLDELQLVLAHGDLVSIRLDGAVALLEDLSKSELQLSVNARNLTDLGAVFHRSLWQAGPVELVAHVHGKSDQLVARAMQLRLGDSRVRGDLKFRRHDEGGHLSAQLQSSQIWLQDFGFELKPTGENDASESPSEDASLWNEPFPLRGLGGLYVDLSLRADRVAGSGGLDVRDLRFDGSLAEGLVRVGDLRIAWDGGHAHAIAQIDGRVSPPTGLLQARLERGQLDQVIAHITQEHIVGVADLWINVTSQGATLAAMLADINGRLVFYGRDGTVPAKYSRALQLDPVPDRFDQNPEDDMEQVNCLIVHLEAENAKTRFENMLFDTPEQQVLVTGDIDFASQKLDLVLSPALKATIPGSVTVPVHIRGSFEHPIVAPAPIATAAAAAEAILDRTLKPIRHFIPGAGDAIDVARRATAHTIGDATGSSGSSLWVPGVDVTCENFLAQEKIARALVSEPSDLEALDD
jgi:hypothetical protein